MREKSKTILMEKLKESVTSVLPITLIVFFLVFSFVPISAGDMVAFIFGAAALIVGTTLFTLGTDMAMTPIGESIGSSVTRTRRLWLILLVLFSVGAMVTVSEPDLQVLAELVTNIPSIVLILAVALGVGLLVVVAVLRIFFRIKLTYLLVGLYIITFTLAAFADSDFIALAFDSGGVTTGPMTVPFIMALGAGIASVRSDRNAENDSFGLVALVCIGPILAVLILGLIYPTEGLTSQITTTVIRDTAELRSLFLRSLPVYLKDVFIALLPIIAIFMLFQVICIKMKRQSFLRICIGLAYTFIGLVLFLTGANVGFMPVGNSIGMGLGALSFRWIVIPVGMLIGYFIVMAEPSVHVLNKQVYEMTSGTVPKKAMRFSLSIGVALSVGLSMLRILLGIPIMYVLIPGYALSVLLTFFVPPMFSAIAFDSGGVASGAMTATFLLPLATGVCRAVGGNVAAEAFGLVATITMTPPVTIQLLGLFYRIKMSRAGRNAASDEPIHEDIIS